MLQKLFFIHIYRKLQIVNKILSYLLYFIIVFVYYIQWASLVEKITINIDKYNKIIIISCKIYNKYQ